MHGWKQLVCTSLCVFASLGGTRAPAEVRGPYLGQKTPGMTPELFAPGIVTTDTSEGCSGWGENMQFFVFQRWVDGKSRLYVMNNDGGLWSAPAPLPFAGRYDVGDFTIGPDGRTMVFASQVLIDEIGKEGEGGNVWFTVHSADGWSTPAYYGQPVNTAYHDSYPALAQDGSLYFFSRRPGGHGDSDLYVAPLVDGKYERVENLGPVLNTEHHEWDAFVAPDGSYMVYCSTKPGGHGEDDLYVSYRQKDGGWGNPVNMGGVINTERSENRPYVTADGKYLFYTSTARGNRDIYWVAAEIVGNLRRNASNAKLEGAYLGQEPPGMTPEIFAPGFISTGNSELNSVFSPDGREFYFSVQTPGKGYQMYVTEETANGWTQPRRMSISDEYSDVDMFITHDGRRMYFGSTRPVDGIAQKDFRIWYFERENGGWGDASYLEAPVNDGVRALYPTISRNGTMFFQAVRDEAPGNRDIYYSLLENGKYLRPIRMGESVNSKYGEGDVFIAPDESYIIVNSNGRPDDRGGGDLYVSFGGKSGRWSPLQNMGEEINSEYTDYCPVVSPDGKYLFFTSKRTGNGDIYWVDAKIIMTYEQNRKLQDRERRAR